jgi:uncharacterized protein (TIGR00725 family)
MVAVIGAGGTLEPETARIAEELGAALVRAGFGVVCGGRDGVMRAVARGAATARGSALHPPVIGILPSYDHDEGNAYLDVVLPTGMGHARNVLVVAAGDAVICVGGATGALSEVALASKIGRPVIALRATGGTADLVARAIPSVVAAAGVQEAVAALLKALS